jgi:hypothetical protein
MRPYLACRLLTATSCSSLALQFCGSVVLPPDPCFLSPVSCLPMSQKRLRMAQKGIEELAAWV